VNFVAGAAAATWQVFALEPHGDNLGTKHSLPVQGRRGDTHTLSLSPPDATTGVFPMLLISTNAANDVHVWVGGILRQ
jgi:hypothetical protein